MADETHTSAIFKRHEQLKRWEESDTNRCPDSLQNKPRKVKFQDGCVFLAACSSGDRDEVKRLLDRGADINTANIDGLTALHQACIDDNLDMVEFLVGKNADVDVCDNEGWTPLHATASCGFTEIARYLLGHGANVAAVNNDGDLPFDICEDDDMEKLLKDAMDEQGVDADAARREEEDRMMEDANQWLNSKIVPDEKHPKTGATALHVAAAKGYIKVISVLLQAGVNIDEKDHDGWTSLHAAAHWGQEESCKILAENMCDMEAKNLAGQTPFDVADTELIKLLEELKTKQASLKDQQKDLQQDIIQTRLPSSRRRSSVTRMSVEQKHNVMKTDQERLPVDGKMPPTKEEERLKGSSSSCSEEETSESDTEKKNEINKQTSEQNQPRDRDKPPVMTTVEIKAKQDTPKVEENNESPGKENIKNLEEDKTGLKKEVDVIGDGLKKIVDDKIINESTDINKETKEIEKDILKKDLKEEKVTENDKEEKSEENEKDSNDQTKSVQMDENTESNKGTSRKEIIDENEDKEKEDKFIENVSPRKEREPVKRTVSAPGSVQEVPRISINSKYLKDSQKGEIEIPSWRLGLRKTGSTSMVPHDSVNTINEDDKTLPRSASSPRLAEENENKKNESSDKPTRRPFLSSSSFTAADQNNSNNSDRLGGSTNSYRYSIPSQNSSSSYHTAYVPFYKRQQAENERKERERAAEKEAGSNRISAPASLPVTSTSNVTSPTISTTSSSTTITTPTSSFVHYRKSYEPPKRDEETEMQRKVRAKRARESRRSTQGVTLEELQQANEVLRKTDSEDSSTTTTTTTTTTGTTSTTLGTADRSSRISEARKSQDVTDSKDTSSSNISDRLSGDISGLQRTQSSNESDRVSSWRRSRTEREEASKKDDDSRTSLRRSRMVDRDLTQSAPASSLYSTESTYVPRNRLERSERNALSTDLSNTSLGTSANLTRSASLRTDRIRPADDDSSRIELRRDREAEKKSIDSSDKNDKNDKEKEEKRPESSAMRNRRMRRERRSTGIANYTAETKDEDEDKDKENKEESKDENKTDKSETEEKTAGRFNRYGSASDVPTHLSDKHTRPSSYSEYSRSTPALDKDYKRMYEAEKLEKEQLKRDLDQCKKDLREAKSELDKQMKKNEANRLTDTNDKREKRALERKLSELEEEIKKMDQLKEDNRRLREENGALIRVISKLSK